MIHFHKYLVQIKLVQNYLLEDQTALKNYQNEESSVAQKSNSDDLQELLVAVPKEFDHKTI